MRQNLKRTLGILLAAIILLSGVSFAWASFDWESYWQQNGEEIARGVYVAPGHTESERIIRWYTEEKDGNTVAVSKSEDMNGAVTFTAGTVPTLQGDYSAEAEIKNLKSGKTYYYTCSSGSYSSPVYHFETASGSDFSALYVTDVHISLDDRNINSVMNQSGKFASVISQANEKADISVILSAGDQASEGRRAEYCGFVSPVDAKNNTVAILEGNHDRKYVDYKYFNANPEKENGGIRSYIGGDYWFVKGDCLFLMMDTNNGDGMYHYGFIKEAVKANPGVKWRVAMFHHDLLGGRIPHREAENKLIRLLIMPMLDEFAVDLVLMGHSHYYTISNVVYNRKTVLSTKDIDSVTDPAGTVYMVSGSINRPRGVDPDNLPPVGENIGQYVDTDKVIYNILDFSEDSITIKSYYLDEEDSFNTFTISKTSQAGGHPKFGKNPVNYVVRFLGRIYALFNNIGKYNDLKEHGCDIPFFDAVIGR
ncbi:MAG: metallophosphoesterase [Clostridiales bacterium]|nr:metallophosphoesterase [Clostridiales bacterium]